MVYIIQKGNLWQIFLLLLKVVQIGAKRHINSLRTPEDYLAPYFWEQTVPRLYLCWLGM